MRGFIIILLFSIGAIDSSAQKVLEQGMCHCGVTGDGYSTGISGVDSGYIKPHIPAGATIKEAYLFTYTMGHPPDASITLNDVEYKFNNTNNITSVEHFNTYATPIQLYFKDITFDIDTATVDSFKVKIPQQVSPHINWSWFTTYLWILYEKPGLANSNYAILINDKNLIGYEKYHVDSLNPIDTNYPTGFAVYLDRIGSGIGGNNNTLISVNNTVIGRLRKADINSTNKMYSGTKGSFYYENNNLYGLQDDTSDNSLGDSDGLANISPYLLQYSKKLDWKIKDTLYPNMPFASVNLSLSYFLTYTSPCDTFSTAVTPDTTICQGATLQLNATGGQSYEWTSIKDTSSNDLSCTNCPNPVFTGDSSQVYTVRIWNNDSCSVVRPVRVTVLPPLKNKLETEETPCGANKGMVKVKNTNAYQSVFAVTESGDTLSTNSNKITTLAAGEYTVFYTDTNGCRSADTSITIGSYNNTNAVFVAEPLSGKVPLQVNLENNSQNADTYSWTINGEEQPQPFTGFTADTSGNYELQLIGWQYDKSCADTVKRTIWVYDNTVVKVSEAISPNGDGKNDVFFIDQLDMFPGTKVWIYNRWGNLVYHSNNYQNDWSGTSQSQTTIGKGNKLPEGTYYYVIELGGKVVAKEEDKIKKGYVYLKR